MGGLVLNANISSSFAGEHRECVYWTPASDDRRWQIYSSQSSHRFSCFIQLITLRFWPERHWTLSDTRFLAVLFVIVCSCAIVGGWRSVCLRQSTYERAMLNGECW